MSTGVDLISMERQRQVKVEKWTDEHDDQHTGGDLALAAACYATPAGERHLARDHVPAKWPWPSNAWKPSPTNRIRELVKAGALIAAEIDRILRKQVRETKAAEWAERWKAIEPKLMECYQPGEVKPERNVPVLVRWLDANQKYHCDVLMWTGEVWAHPQGEPVLFAFTTGLRWMPVPGVAYTVTI